MKVKVTQKHIKKGKPTEPSSCPIAYSLREMGFSEVNVDNTNVEMIAFGTKLKFPLPNKAQTFISNFDAEKPVKPFEFTIELPKNVVKLAKLLVGKK